MPSAGRILFALTAPVLTALASGCAAVKPAPQFAYFPPPPSPPHVVRLTCFNELSDLAPPQLTLGQRLYGTPPGPFVESPMGLNYREGHLYICDVGLRLVHDWDLHTGHGRTIGAAPPHTLDTPVAVATDDGGNVYVADTGRGEVIAFNADGLYRFSYAPEKADGYRPVALAVHKTNLYVADAASGNLDVYALDSAFPTASFPLSEGEKGAMPMGLAVGADGRLLVSDMLGGRVLVLTADGKVESAIAQRGNRHGDLGQPRHIAVGPDGVLFIADAEFGCVHLFNQAGELLLIIDGLAAPGGAAPLPVGVTAAAMLPDGLSTLVPAEFAAHYFVLVSNRLGSPALTLFAVGEQKSIAR